MLVYSLLQKEKRSLNFLGSSDDNVEVVLNTITELKKHNANLRGLAEVEGEIEDKYLQTKVSDINKIFTQYEGVIKDRFIDEDDALSVLAKQLEENKMFEDTEVYVDEFSGFTDQEYNVIRKIISQANETYVSICLDPEEVDILTTPEADIFYYNKRTMKRIEEIAFEVSSEIKEPVILSKRHRFKTKELSHLEENIYSRGYKKCEEAENIKLVLADNTYSELEYIAKTITKIVMEEGIKYKDIAILTKDTEGISAASKTVFEKYDIPFFIDQKEELNQNAFAKYVLSVLDIFKESWSKTSVFSYLKSGLYDDLEKAEVYALENYADKWGIRGAKWYKEPWADEKFEKMRLKVVEPLLQFKEEADGASKKTAKEISTALYNFLKKNNIKEKMRKEARGFYSGWRCIYCGRI